MSPETNHPSKNPNQPTMPTAPEVINTPIINEAIDESTPAFIGLRIAIAKMRLGRTERAGELADELVNTKQTRQEVASSVLNNRMPSPYLSPKTRGDARTGKRTSRNRTKVMTANVEAIRLAGIYGAHDEQGRDLIELGKEEEKDLTYLRNFHSPEERKKREYDGDEAQHQVNIGRFAQPATFPNDLGTQAQQDRLANVPYSKPRIRSEKKAVRNLDKTRARANKYGGRIKETMEGSDVPSQIIRVRAERNQNRADKLSQHLQHLEELREQNNQIKKARRQKRKSPKQ